MRVVSVVNQKGGVAKTTTCANLGAALADRGLRVLVMDLDPQANLTLGLRCEMAGLPYALPAVLLDPTGHPLARVLRQVPGLSMALAPGHMDLASCEAALIRRGDPPLQLRTALSDPRIEQTFEWVLIDCPPSLGLLTQNAILASTHLLIPTEPKMYAFAGMSTLNQMVEDLARSYRFDIELLGVVLTMYDERTKLHKTVAGIIAERFGDKVFRTVIHRNIRLSDAEVAGTPIVLCDRSARGAKEYAALADEVVQRVGGSP